jgi:hypothetical protein
VEPARPLTHDLIRDLIAALGHSLKEVRIVDLQEGTFYADLVFDQDITVSARPSDSVAIALRMGVPIYVEEAVLAEAGLLIPTSPTKRHQARSARTRSRSSRNFSTPSRPTISRPPDLRVAAANVTEPSQLVIRHSTRPAPVGQSRKSGDTGKREVGAAHSRRPDESVCS